MENADRLRPVSSTREDREIGFDRHELEWNVVVQGARHLIQLIQRRKGGRIDPIFRDLSKVHETSCLASTHTFLSCSSFVANFEYDTTHDSRLALPPFAREIIGNPFLERRFRNKFPPPALLLPIRDRSTPFHL